MLTYSTYSLTHLLTYVCKAIDPPCDPSAAKLVSAVGGSAIITIQIWHQPPDGPTLPQLRAAFLGGGTFTATAEALGTKGFPVSAGARGGMGVGGWGKDSDTGIGPLWGAGAASLLCATHPLIPPFCHPPGEHGRWRVRRAGRTHVRGMFASHSLPRAPPNPLTGLLVRATCAACQVVGGQSSDALTAQLLTESVAGLTNIFFVLDGIWGVVIFWALTSRGKRASLAEGCFARLRRRFPRCGAAVARASCFTRLCASPHVQRCLLYAMPTSESLQACNPATLHLCTSAPLHLCTLDCR